MNIYDLGFKDCLTDENSYQGMELMRVIAQHKEQFVLSNGAVQLNAEISGKFRYMAESSEDMPVVGDWVATTIHDDLAIIHHLLERRTMLARKSVHHDRELQVIVANVDIAFIVQGLDRDFNVNRLDRYITMIISGKVKPVVILNKSDLLSSAEIDEKKQLVLDRHSQLEIMVSSFMQKKSIKSIKSRMVKGETYCFIGSSGVGKSTLINSLLEQNVIKTKSLSDSTHKGQHTTSSRQLLIMDDGALVIDTPGMRELGIVSAESGIQDIFSSIYESAKRCKFKDCSHTTEKGCAIQEAISLGEISQPEFDSYLKLQKEDEYNNSTMLERRQKDKKFGKMIKEVMSHKKKAKGR